MCDNGGMDKHFLTVRETSALLRVSVWSIYRMTAERRLPHIKVGARTLIDEEKLQEFLEEHSIPVEAAPVAAR